MVAPTGVEARMEMMIPTTAQNTAMVADEIITDKKLWNTRMEETAGKIISAEINKDPTSFIASTIMVAVITAMSKLYLSAFVPVAFAKFSSKVMAKILL